MVKSTDIQPVDVPSVENLSSGWLKIVRRLQSVARHQQGLAFIRIVVLVDAAGEPQIWFSPDMKLIEPKMRAEDLLKKMSPEELQQILQMVIDEV